MSFVELVWLLLIFGGITVALWLLWAETVNAWYEWHDADEDER